MAKGNPRYSANTPSRVSNRNKPYDLVVLEGGRHIGARAHTHTQPQADMQQAHTYTRTHTHADRQAHTCPTVPHSIRTT